MPVVLYVSVYILRWNRSLHGAIFCDGDVDVDGDVHMETWLDAKVHQKKVQTPIFLPGYMHLIINALGSCCWQLPQLVVKLEGEDVSERQSDLLEDYVAR